MTLECQLVGMSLILQAVIVGLDNLNLDTLAIDTFSGALYGTFFVV